MRQALLRQEKAGRCGKCFFFSLPHPPPRPGAIGRAAIRFGPHGQAQAARLPGLFCSHSKDTSFACSQSCVLMLCVRFDAILLKKAFASLSGG